MSAHVAGNCQCATCSPSGVEWATPQDLFDAVSEAHGPFMLDACATDENAKCRGWYTKRDDALTLPWVDEEYPAVWMNAPYGRGIGAWVKKARAEAMKGGIVACLLPAKMDTAWWHDHVWGGHPADNLACFDPAVKLGPYTAAHLFLDGYGTELNIDIYFIRGRLGFNEGSGKGWFASAVVVFDGRKDTQ